jgi:hypothetical protein
MTPGESSHIGHPPEEHLSSAGNLPPVEAPNARVIIQLFVVPSVLVVLVMGFILLFFGGVGGGPRTAEQFYEGLTSASGHKRQQTAHDLAQVLPRSAELRHNAKFALDLTDMLLREMEVAELAPADPKPGGIDSVLNQLDYLPQILGNFSVPVALPVLLTLIRDQVNGKDQQLIRARNAIVAVGNLGHRLREFDVLSSDEKEKILLTLQSEAGDRPGRQTLAQEAYAYLKARVQAANGNHLPQDYYGVVATLSLAARANDELTRKYTIVALANWQAPGVDELLRQMTDVGPDLTVFEDGDSERGRREIRYNAALALARRASPLTPNRIVLETLDEEFLAKAYPNTKTSPATRLMLKALADLAEFKRLSPEQFSQRGELLAAARKLTASENLAVQVEARRLLEGKAPPAITSGYFSRQLLLMTGVGLGVIFFLGLAVFARWRRSSPSSSMPTS